MIPKGIYKVNEENEKEIDENTDEATGQVKVPSTDDMSKPEMWAHYT